ncbi:MAG TPA: NAD(P)H-dependent glycerol-3-phosphate dehydrogenase [Steroidobacteraceae bacterium]|nr:NAD(P)H-dependent glycerol-3-phosphate dehydrogenase [Steroidobacteraceae bacterium]
MAALPPSLHSAPITIIGAGSWGTALAIQFARAGRPVKLWGRNTNQLKDMHSTRSNARYLPGVVFPDLLSVELDLANALTGSTDVLIAAPSHAFRELLLQLKPVLSRDVKLAWATKGFELNTGKLPHEVVTEVLGAHLSMAVLSGPTFAKEVGAGLPTAMTVASTDATYAMHLAKSISGHHFRAYTSTDLIGVEVGGAVKNVLAIGTGMSDGLGFGANTRIALITRGLVEMTRLGVALGAQKETFMGLAGLGDLVLTCTDNQSRNRRFGLAFAAGTDSIVAQHEIGQVVEGVAASRAVMTVAKNLAVEMPICTQVYRTLHEGLSPKEAVKELMSREIKAEAG